MPSAVVNTQTVAGIALANGNDLIVTSTGSIAVLTGNAVGLTGDNELAILGDVISVANTAIIGVAPTFTRMTIGSTGQVTSGTVYDAINITADASVDIVNHGLISGYDGIDLLRSDVGSTYRIINTGTIFGLDDGVSVGPGSGTARVVNDGVIGNGNYGIFVSTSSLSGSATITNSGVIAGAVNSFLGRDTSVTLRNSGEMFGEIEFGDLDDVYNGRFGFTDSNVLGEGGNDTLKGGDENNTLDGGADNDMLYGFGGNDSLIGGAGNDTLRGNLGDDILEGGGKGDVLVGGKGNDTLSGGGGGDTFVFRRVANGDDEITDFQNGTDIIDLSALGVQNLNRLVLAGALSNDTDAAVIDLSLVGGSGSIRVVGIQVSDLDGSDFIF